MAEREQDEEEDDVLGNFMFGNVDEHGRPEIDYLDQDAYEGLKNVKDQLAGDLLEVDVRVEDGKLGGPSARARTDHNPAARDFADEKELADDTESNNAAPAPSQWPGRPAAVAPVVPLPMPAVVASFLDDEDDYDEPEPGGAAAQPPPVPAAALPIKPPTAVRPTAPSPPPPRPTAAEPHASQRLMLPALGRCGQETVLQLSQVFCMPSHEVEKYLSEPLTGEEAEEEAAVAALTAVRARRARRLAELRAAREKRAVAGEPPRAVPSTPVGAEEAEEEVDELTLMSQVLDDPVLLAQYQQQRAALLLPPSSPGDAEGPPIKTHAGTAPAMVQPVRPRTATGPAPAVLDPGPAVVGGRVRATGPPEVALDAGGSPLVPPSLQIALARLLKERLAAAQAGPLAEELRHPHSTSDPVVAALADPYDPAPWPGAGSEEDTEDVEDMLGVVPASLAEPGNMTRWEDSIWWDVGASGSAGSAAAASAPRRTAVPPDPGAPPTDAAPDAFHKSVAEALASGALPGDGSSRGQVRPAAATNPQPGQLLGVPHRVFGPSLHPQSLRLVPEAGPAVGAEVIGAVAPANNAASLLARLEPSGRPALALPDPQWEERVLWDASRLPEYGRTADTVHLAAGVSASAATSLRLTSGTLALGGAAGAESGNGAGEGGEAATAAVPLSLPLAWVLAAQAAVPAELRTPLLLDLNDPRMAFHTAQPEQMASAAALVLAAPALPAVKHGPPVDPNDEVARDLARFNVSKDAEYGHAVGGAGRRSRLELRDASAQKAADVKHAVPALTLTTFPARLDPAELVSFHRPRARWHASDVPRKPAVLVAEDDDPSRPPELHLSIVSLTGREHITHLEYKTWSAKTLADLVKDPTLRLGPRFPEVASEPFQMVALKEDGTATAPLGLSLTMADLQPTPGSLDLILTFPRIKVLPSREANAVPTLESNRPLRPPAAFSKKTELSGREGHVLLLEYLEERPALLGRPGMGVKLLTYYKQKDEDDGGGALLAAAAGAPQQVGAGLDGGGGGGGGVTPMLALPGGFIAGPTGRLDTWRVGALHQLGPEQDSPFMGALKPGVPQLSVETLMYRAPAKAHATQTTDFLLIRSATGALSLREVTGTVVVGQQQPLITVPDPQSQAAVELMSNRLIAHVLRELRRKKLSARPGSSEAQGIRMSDLMELFPLLSVAHIKKMLLERCGCQPKGGAADDLDAVYDFAPGANTLPESELRKLASPDRVAAYECGRAAEERLTALGLANARYLANIHPDLIKLAIEMLPLNEPAVAAASEVLEHELAAGLPWRTTEAFTACVNDRSRLLQVDASAGDPTGRGHGFAYVLRPEPLRPPEAAGLAQPEMGTITGSDCDLRKISNKEAAKILRDFGITPEVIALTTDRWKRIDMVRKLCTAAASDGVHSELTRRYTRVIKYSFADHVAMLKGQIGRVWDAQVEVLGGDINPPGAAAAAAMLASLRKDRLAAIEKGITSAHQRLASQAAQGAELSEDQAEYLRMQREGFFGEGGGPSGGAGGGGGSRALEAKPGERRIRRLIAWVDGAGQRRTRELIISDKTDLYAVNTMCKAETAFGTRTLRPPAAEHTRRALKTVVPGRLAAHEMSRVRGGRARGRGRGSAMHILQPSIRLPTLRPPRASGTRGAKAKRGARGIPAGDDPEGGEEDGEEEPGTDRDDAADLLPGQPTSRPATGADGGPPSASKKKARKSGPPAVAVRCTACGGLGHEAGHPDCLKATVHPDEAVSDLEDEKEEVHEGAYRPTTTRAERAERGAARRAAMAAAEAAGLSSPGSGGVGSGGQTVRVRMRRADDGGVTIRTAPPAASAGASTRVRRKTAQAAVDGFRKVRGRGEDSEEDEEPESWELDLVDDGPDEVVDGGGSDDEPFSLDGEEDEDEDLPRFKRARRTASGAPTRSAGGGYGGGGGVGRAPIARRASGSIGGGGHEWPATSGAATADSARPATVEEGKAELRRIFKECIDHLLARPGAPMSPFSKKQHFQPFVERVAGINVPDYTNWVKENDQMYIKKLMNNVKSQKYLSRGAFMADVDKILTNAERYNTPGCGQLATPDLITLAEELVGDAAKFLDRHAAQVQAAEDAIRSGVVAAAPPGAPAEAVPVEVAWVQCARCSKWRIVPPAVHQYVTAQGEHFQWFCEQLEGLDCSMPEANA